MTKVKSRASENSVRTVPDAEPEVAPVEPTPAIAMKDIMAMSIDELNAAMIEESQHPVPTDAKLYALQYRRDELLRGQATA